MHNQRHKMYFSSINPQQCVCVQVFTLTRRANNTAELFESVFATRHVYFAILSLPSVTNNAIYYIIMFSYPDRRNFNLSPRANVVGIFFFFKIESTSNKEQKEKLFNLITFNKQNKKNIFLLNFEKASS